jgi:hypothetical protein
MQFSTIVAAFFLEQTGSAPTVEEVAISAGLTDLRPLDDLSRRALGFHEPDRLVLAGSWGAFGDTWCIVDEVDGYWCLQCYSSMNDYLDAQIAGEGREGTDEDPVLPYVAIFRDACLALRPEVAFLDTRAHYGDKRWEDKQGNRDWVLSQSWMVATADVNALADERFSLLYLSATLVRLWTPDPRRDDRDYVDVPTGRLAFARSGPARMA